VNYWFDEKTQKVLGSRCILSCD